MLPVYSVMRCVFSPLSGDTTPDCCYRVWLLSVGNGVNRCCCDIVIPHVRVDLQLIFAIDVVDLIYSANISVYVYIRIRLRIILCSYLSLKSSCVVFSVYNVPYTPQCPTPPSPRSSWRWRLRMHWYWYSVYFNDTYGFTLVFKILMNSNTYRY